MCTTMSGMFLHRDLIDQIAIKRKRKTAPPLMSNLGMISTCSLCAFSCSHIGDDMPSKKRVFDHIVAGGVAMCVGFTSRIATRLVLHNYMRAWPFHMISMLTSSGLGYSMAIYQVK
jgi:hypothetical protein